MEVGPSCVLVLDEVGLRVGRHDLVKGASLQLQPGSVAVVGGENGSGKTSLLRLMVNACRPTSGRRYGPKSSAYVPAGLQPTSLKVSTWIAATYRHSVSEHKAVLQELGFEGDCSRRCDQLSFGNFRKVALAGALGSQARLIVIDEAAAGLDDRGVAGLTSCVADRAAKGATVVIAGPTHQPWIQSDQRFLVHAGTVAEVPIHNQPVTISFEGPADLGERLIGLAAELGFRPAPKGR